MSENLELKKTPKPPKSLDVQIDHMREKLRKLEDERRTTLRKERERNQRAVFELLKNEKLDLVSPDLWMAALPKLRELLKQVPAPVLLTPLPVSTVTHYVTDSTGSDVR